jgi:predicted CXXCH cytochrome family protein
MTDMKLSFTRVAWAYGLAAALVGALATAALCADAPATPAYLATAKYIGLAKCKMCHNANSKMVPPESMVYPYWATTKHASFNAKLPWEGDANAKPTEEDIYRHTTGYDPATKTYVDKGITCEACHGPGSAHMMSTKDAKKTTIMDPEDLKTPGQQISVCGRCHGQYTVDGKRVALKYVAGQDLTTTPTFKLDPVQGDKPMQEMNEVMGSKHYAKGMTCISCHISHAATTGPHSLKQPVNDQCMSCHKDKTMANHAPNAAKDATCATCHMPNGSHSFVKPAK